MNKIITDVYYNIFAELSFKDIIKLCNTNKQFKEFSLQNQKFMDKIKLKAVKKLLKESEDKIRDFAYKNNIGFDNISTKRSIETYMMCRIIDKFTLDLLYLVNNKFLHEAYVLIDLTNNIPEPTLSIFIDKLFEKFPKKIIEIYMKKLPPILELFGYDNEDDFFEDYPLDRFINKHLQRYISDNCF
jgi:hypothetical protein